MRTRTTPALYVGTYSKYNDGNLTGEWVDLEDFADADEFMDYCYQLHADEEDAEIMFQDFEGFPQVFYSESMNTDSMVNLYEYVKLSEDEKEIVDAYLEIEPNGTIGDALSTYYGTYASWDDFVHDYADNLLDAEGVTGGIARDFFDYEYFGKTSLRFDFIYNEVSYDKCFVFADC